MGIFFLQILNTKSVRYMYNAYLFIKEENDLMNRKNCQGSIFILVQLS